MYMKKAIIVLIGTDKDQTRHYFGPFDGSAEAAHWGFNNCRGFEWHWEYMNPVNLIELVAGETGPIESVITRDLASSEWEA